MIAILSLLVNCACLLAMTPNSKDLADLEAKLNQAQPKDRCILYALLVNRMMDLAGQQLQSGDSEAASRTLQQVKGYLESIHSNAMKDSKKVKNAELLIRQSSVRFKDILRESSPEDRSALESMLKQLNAVQEQLMMLVFSK